MPTLTFILALALAPASGPLGEALTADVDGDGAPDRLTFYATPDRTRGFLQLDPGPRAADSGASRTSPIYPAWKALAGRLDASGIDLVVLGTWTRKGTRPGDRPKRSVWVVALEGARWVERWRGSALARPFEDYTLVDVDADHELELVVRECQHGLRAYSAYRWQGFGFQGKARSTAAGPCTTDEEWPRMTMKGGRLWLGP
jgi:hypothetical protein